MKQYVMWKKRFSIYVKRVKIDSYFISCLVLSCIWHEIRLGSYKVTYLFIQILFTPYSLFASKSLSAIKEKQVKPLLNIYIYLINCYIITYVFISCKRIKIILNDGIIEIYISNFSINSKKFERKNVQKKWRKLYRRKKIKIFENWKSKDNIKLQFKKRKIKL